MVSIFIVLFGIYFSINLSTRLALIKDNQEQEIHTNEIEFKYSKLSGKFVSLVVDKNNEADKYYYISSLPNIAEKDVKVGGKYIISYYKYSKVICDIEVID